MKGNFEQQQIESVLPSGLSLSKILPIDQGISSYTYRIETSEGILYFSTLVEEYRNKRLSPRMMLLNQIYATGMRVPKPLAYQDFDRRLDGYSWALVTEVPGKQLADNSKSRLQVLSAAGRDLARLHQIDAKGFGYVRDLDDKGNPVGEDPSYFYHLTESLRYKAPFSDKMKTLVEENMISTGQAADIFNFIEKNKYLVDINQGVLMHGDYSKEHIFENNGVYSGVIDWDGIGVGTGLYDLAQFSVQNPDEDFNALLEGYLEISDHDDDQEFQERFFVERLLFLIPKLAKTLKSKKAGKRYADDKVVKFTLDNFSEVLKRF